MTKKTHLTYALVATLFKKKKKCLMHSVPLGSITRFPHAFPFGFVCYHCCLTPNIQISFLNNQCFNIIVEVFKSKAFLARRCAHFGLWLFATTFLLRLTTHDKLSYMKMNLEFIRLKFFKGIWNNLNQMLHMHSNIVLSKVWNS